MKIQNPPTVLSSFGEENILKSLKHTDLEVVKLRMEGLTYQEIADMYGKTRQNIGAKMSRIQKIVNRHLGVATV